MKRSIRGWWVGAIALLIASAAQATAPGENANLAASADGILVGLPLVAFGLKGLVNEDRPNGEPHSFPSAHTSTTFAGAEFIRKEYGWSWGAPLGDQPEETGAAPGLSLEMHF